MVWILLCTKEGVPKKGAQGIPDFQAPPPIPKFIDTEQAIDELPPFDSFEPSPDDF